MGCSTSRVAPELASLPPTSACLSSWRQFIDTHNTNSAAAKDDTLETRLSTASSWTETDLKSVALGITNMQGTNSQLSPVMRMQLWIACAGINSDRTDVSSEKDSLWGAGWFERALEVANAMQSSVVSSSIAKSSSPPPPPPLFDSTIEGDLMTLTSESVKSFTVIDNDVPRTLHNFSRFMYPPTEVHLKPPESGSEQESLRRVLRAFVATRPDINYTQGMNFIAALFLRVLWSGGLQENGGSTDARQQREMLACGMLRRVAKDMGMDEMWRVEFPLLHSLSEKLMTALQQELPKSAARLRKEGLPPSAFTTSWMITLFTSGNKLPPVDLLRWWDNLWLRSVCDLSAASTSTSMADIQKWSSPDERSRAVESWLLKSMVRIMKCHSLKIEKAKDTVTVMNILKSELTQAETRKLFAAAKS